MTVTAATKRCARCGEVKNRELDYWWREIRGRWYPAAYCRDCQRAYHLDWSAKRRAKS